MTTHTSIPIDFEAFWAAPGRAAWSSVADVGLLASLLQRACGGGPLLDVGCGSGTLLAAWRARGLVSRGVDRSRLAVEACNRFAPGCACVADAASLPFEAASFDTVVSCGLACVADESAFRVAISEMARVARHAVVVIVPERERLAAIEGARELSRADVDAMAFAAGLRRHPMEMQVVSYGSLELDPAPRVMIYEPIPVAAATRYPQQWLEKSRDLHMDHARDSGRRADAHLARYQLAAQWVRRGDRVLDAACGMGYGSRLLAVASGASSVRGVDLSSEAVEYAAACYGSARVAFSCENAAELDSLANESVDLVACFETLEHVADPAALLARVHEVLSPGGRLIVSVPNNWADESGKDPNPHHLHVYTRERLLAELRERFIVEHLSLQDAGGGWKSQGRSRRLETAPRTGSEPQAEWWIAVVMKSPLGASKEGFRERLFPEQPSDDQAYNLYRFERDYDNPALFRSMICMGPRLSDEAELASLATAVLESARGGSPDEGAAACVLAYQALHAGDATDRRAAVETLELFAARSDGSPHAQRWVISGEYVAALLLLSMGDVGGAIARFTRCASMDAAAFSPLLGTKTVDAACRAGALLASQGRLAEARASWTAGIREAKRLVGGSWLNVIGEEAQPQPFGLHELAQVVDAASHCAGWLQVADRLADQPGFAWAESARQTFGDTRQYVNDLLAARNWLEARISVVGDEAQRVAEARFAFEADRYARERAWLESQVAGFRAAEAKAIASYEEVKAWSLELQQAREWLEGERTRLEAERLRLEREKAEQFERARSEAASLVAQIDRFRETSAALEQARDWQARQTENWMAEAQARLRSIEELKAAMAKVEEGRDWNARQAANWKAEAEARAAVAEELKASLASADQAREAQMLEAAACRERVESLNASLAALEASFAAYRTRGLLDRILNRDRGT